MIQQRTRRARQWPTLLVAGAVSATLAACGGGSGDDDPFGGVGDGGGIDVNGDGVIDSPIGEPDANGVRAYDINEDGLPDTEISLGQFDSNNDGFEDRDVNGDGVVDDSILDGDGNLIGYETDARAEDRDGTADSDASGMALGPNFTEPDDDNPCGSQPDGDPDSSNADWNDNCQVSRANQFATSQYTKGIQRVVWCSGFQGNSGATTVEQFADGIFGANTQLAVEAFQERELGAAAADGIVGPATWGALQGVLGPLLSADVDDGNGIVYEAATVGGERCGSQALFYNEVANGTELRGWTLAEPVGSANRAPFSIDAP